MVGLASMLGRPGRSPMTTARAARLAVAAIVAAVVVVLAAACSATPTAAPTALAGRVRMIDYGFDPANLTVPRNSMIWVVNGGKVPHSWIIPKVGVGTQDLAPGQSQELDLSGIAPGTYSVTCDLPGHAQLGSVGTVTIMQ
jgi:plastocyanin